MAKIELNSRDLHIKTLDNGKEVVQIKGSTAFDDDFLNECKSNGVREYVEYEKESDY